MDRPRLATVPFINAEPLTWGFTSGPFRGLFDLQKIAPSRIPDLMRSGEIDVGLIPSIEYQRLDGVEVIPYLCVASKRRVRSVYLASRTPLEKVRRIAVDANSRTSVALLRIILAHRGIRDVVTTERTPPLDVMLRDHDAALLIGDAALTARTEGLEVRDLAAEWFSITGLPFVFAFWAVRADRALPDGIRPFLESRTMGIAKIPLIAREAGARLRIDPGVVEEYLRVDIHYHMASEENRSLDLFYRQARELDLIPAHRPLEIREPAGRETVRNGRKV